MSARHSGGVTSRATLALAPIFALTVFIAVMAALHASTAVGKSDAPPRSPDRPEQPALSSVSILSEIFFTLIAATAPLFSFAAPSALMP